MSLKQDTVTYISYHIHEWRHQCHLIKYDIVDQLLIEWITKSFVNNIVKDIAMGGCVTEERAIRRTEYLYLVYS